VAGALSVDANTNFSWAGPGGVSVFKVVFNSEADAMLVVTAKQQARLPTFPGTGFAIPPGAPCSWSVQTHGHLATVDDATSPAGMLDSFAASLNPAGLNHGSGSFTESEQRGFTTSP
jgi:hypothetical protein